VLLVLVQINDWVKDMGQLGKLFDVMVVPPNSMANLCRLPSLGLPVPVQGLC
jgi:hypothetical protein